MKACAYCQQFPQWHYCRNVSRQRGGDFYLIEGCGHAEAFAKPFAFIAESRRPEFAEKWDAEAERLFATYTDTWTDPQRVSYRTRLFEERVVTEMPLVTEQAITATKELIAKHRSRGPDDEP